MRAPIMTVENYCGTGNHYVRNSANYDGSNYGGRKLWRERNQLWQGFQRKWWGEGTNMWRKVKCIYIGSFGKIYPKLAKVAKKIVKIMKSYQSLEKFTNSYQKVAKYTKSNQKLQKVKKIKNKSNK